MATVYAEYDGSKVKDTIKLKPVHLRVTSVTGNRVRLEWNNYTAPNGFVIKRISGITGLNRPGTKTYTPTQWTQIWPGQTLALR